jgi:GNAT superfamily N-acetyltransferase
VLTARPSRAEDGVVLRDIEWQAGEQFRTVGLDAVAEDEPASVEELAAYAALGRSWVVVDAADVPVGYVLVDIVEGNAHVEQVSVRPEMQGKGAGRLLIDRVRTWAIETGRPAISLTTFADVPWNRPLYEHLGFRVLDEHEVGPELRAVREIEATHGLDPSTRVCMLMAIGPDARIDARNPG